MVKAHNSPESDFDIVIVGGGPAGCCAAIRLAGLGHRVALVEAAVMPIYNPGEMLTPGIRQILDSIGALDILEGVEIITGLNSVVIWETRNPVLRATTDHLIVNRKRFDLSLRLLAEKCGVTLYCPAKFLEAKEQGSGSVILNIFDDRRHALKCKYLIDARGHRSRNFPLAEPQLALWGEYSFPAIEHSTFVEAGKKGWIWASKVTDGRFRLMLFTEPSAVKQAGAAGAANSILSESRIFKTFPYQQFNWRGCDATPVVCAAPWHGRIIFVGDAAFRQDPLSSSGVEKAMRSAWQAATAIHTALVDEQTDMAREYYERCVRNMLARHMEWTRNYYKDSWCYDDSPYLQGRGREPELMPMGASPFLKRVFQRQEMFPKEIKNAAKSIPILPDIVQTPSLQVSISLELRFVQSICVINDHLQRRRAVEHPSLDGPAAFLDDTDIVQLLEHAKDNPSTSDLLSRWTKYVHPDKGRRLFQSLFSAGILIVKS